MSIKVSELGRVVLIPLEWYECVVNQVRRQGTGSPDKIP